MLFLVLGDNLFHGHEFNQLLERASARRDGASVPQTLVVRFADGSVEEVDAIVFATGYKITFPFFDEAELKPDADHRFPLFKRMMKPGVPNLFFMGLAQPLPTLVNFAEQQAKLAAAYLAGQYAPPAEAEMVKIMEKDEALHTGHFYESARHTIQVDFNVYCADLKKEIAKGEARAKATGGRLPVAARAEAAKTQQLAPT